MKKTDFKKTLDSYKAKSNPESLHKLRLAELDEGTVVQMLHLGSFASEGPVLKALHEEFVPDNDLQLTGKHHEIYFSDFRKTAPDKLRTLLRQPVLRSNGSS